MAVNIRRIDQAQKYEAPNHLDVHSMRLQGLDAGGADALWVGLTHFLPGGGAGPDSGGLEKIYVVLCGHVTLRTADGEQVLGPLDSVTIPANVEREIRNETNLPASMLVAMPTPAKV